MALEVVDKHAVLADVRPSSSSSFALTRNTVGVEAPGEVEALRAVVVVIVVVEVVAAAVTVVR